MTELTGCDHAGHSEPVRLPSVMEVGRRMYCSIPRDTAEHASAMYRVLNGGAEEFRANVGRELRIRHVVIADDSRVRADDGEVVIATVASVVTDDGRVVSGTSQGVVKSLIHLLVTRGAAPWDPPVVCRVAQRGRMLVLDLIDMGLDGRASPAGPAAPSSAPPSATAAKKSR